MLANPLPPPVMVTTAQFIYISRLPILLNHVQAKSAAPEGAEGGMAKLKGVFSAGQEPGRGLLVRQSGTGDGKGGMGVGGGTDPGFDYAEGPPPVV